VIDQANLRTLSPFVGGGFGSRFHSAEKLAAVRIRDPPMRPEKLLAA